MVVQNWKNARPYTGRELVRLQHVPHGVQQRQNTGANVDCLLCSTICTQPENKMAVEDDPNGKDAKAYRNHPQTEKTLRQFLKMESGAYTRPAYRENYDFAMQKNVTRPPYEPHPCDKCAYVALTETEQTWHEHRNEGHECHPGKVVEIALCRICGNPQERCVCDRTGP